MRRSLLVAAVALAIATPLVAQTCPQANHYPTGNTPNVGSQNNWPFNIYTDWRFQFIIASGTMPTTPVKITDMAFAPSFYSGRIFTSPNFQMRMNCTTFSNFSSTAFPANCFDTVLGPCPTTVFNGPIRWDCRNTDTWSDVGLQCSFGYDPKCGNIVTEIRYQGGNSGQSQGCVVRTDPSIPRAYTHNGGSSDPFNAPCWIIPIPGELAGPIVRLTLENCCIVTCDPQVSEGGAGKINVLSGTRGDLYQVATSLGEGPPGLAVGGCRVCLAFDSVFFASLFVGPPVFLNYAGTLDANGGAQATVNVPRLGGALKGLCLYHAAICYKVNPFVPQCSNTCGMQIQ